MAATFAVRFMSANQADFPVVAMTRVLGVSKAGYYAWASQQPSARTVADAALLKRIRTVHLGSHEIYGAPRVHADLREQGVRYSRKRIARLMREAGLVGASHRRGGPVTTRWDREARPAPDLVDRNFAAAAPNRLWVADITQILSANQDPGALAWRCSLSLRPEPIGTIPAETVRVAKAGPQGTDGHAAA